MAEDESDVLPGNALGKAAGGSDFVAEDDSEVAVKPGAVKLGVTGKALTNIPEETQEEYLHLNTHDGGLPAEFSSKQAKVPRAAAGAPSQATTAPETKRGTVSKDESDDDLQDDVMDVLAESQTRRMAESLKSDRPG